MILCDLDKVLAMNRGLDTTPGAVIHRTFLNPPIQLQRIKDSGIPFYILTAKTEAEAWEILRAVGLEGYVWSVIGAEALFWRSVWHALKNGRMPSAVSKAFYQQRLHDEVSRPRVMIEDRLDRLIEMFEMQCIDFGILVPEIRVVEGWIEEWFDLDAVFRAAQTLAMGKIDEAEYVKAGITMCRWEAGEFQEIEVSDCERLLRAGMHIVKIPKVPASNCSEPLSLQKLDTGCILSAKPRSVVAALCAGRRIVRRLAPRVLAGR
jgi:hypothetical protein